MPKRFLRPTRFSLCSFSAAVYPDLARLSSGRHTHAMCGRYSLTTAPEAMRRLFRVKSPLPNIPARYNVAPRQDMPVVRLTNGSQRELALLRWGLIPFWAKDEKIGYRTINARAETVDVKPAFRAAFRARRCLVPADGFYEWRKENGKKRPFSIVSKGAELMAFAGLWEHWRSPKTQEVIDTFTIIVTEANELLRRIHDRMSMILHPVEYDAWLGGSPSTAQALLRPFPSDELNAYSVSTRVNNPANDDAACIDPIGPICDLQAR